MLPSGVTAFDPAVALDCCRVPSIGMGLSTVVATPEGAAILPCVSKLDTLVGLVSVCDSPVVVSPSVVLGGCICCAASARPSLRTFAGFCSGDLLLEVYALLIAFWDTPINALIACVAGLGDVLGSVTADGDFDRRRASAAAAAAVIGGGGSSLGLLPGLANSSA